MSHDRIDTDSDFSWPSGVRPGSLNRDSDIMQEALQRTKLHMTQAGITVSDDEVFEYLTNAVAAANTPQPAPDAMRSAEPLLNSLDEIVRYLRKNDPAAYNLDEYTELLQAGLKQLRAAVSAPVPPADGVQKEADHLASVVAALKSTEHQDIEFVMLQYGGSHDDRRAFIRSFRNQIINTAAGEMYSRFSPSATGAAEPDYETAARALGFQQIPNGKWFHQGQNHNLERCFESAKEIFDRYFGSHWLATPPVRGDWEMLCEAIRAYCRTVSKAAVQTSSDGNDRIYYAGLSVQGLADAILPVQPGAGERGSDAAEADRYFDLAGEFGNQLQTLAGVAQNAVDILAGRKYGNAARSPGHNARLILETALKNVSPSALPARQPPQSSREG